MYIVDTGISLNRLCYGVLLRCAKHTFSSLCDITSMVAKCITVSIVYLVTCLHCGHKVAVGW